MISFKPQWRVSKDTSPIFIMSEYKVHTLEEEYRPLIEKLQVGIEQAFDLTDAELEQLENLISLGLVTSERETPLINYLELTGIGQEYAKLQLKHIAVEVVDRHTNMYWASQLTHELFSFGVNITRIVKGDVEPKLTLYVVDHLMKLDEMPIGRPALQVKMGSYINSVGPLLDSRFTSTDLKNYIAKNKTGFTDEGFVDPHIHIHVRDLGVRMMALEILHFITRAGSHEAVNGIVEWDLANMRRNVWAR